MELLLRHYYSWVDLLVAALILYGIYLLLLLVRDRLSRSKRIEGFRAAVYSVLAPFLLVYEPIAVLVLVMIFLFINPIPHGVVVLLVIVAGFTRIRDYLSGRIVLFNPLVAVGKRMHVDKFTGVISRISRMGVYLQTGEGIHFVNFTTLITQGFSLITGKDIGGYYQLHIDTNEHDRDEALRELTDQLMTTPYLNRGFRPEFTFAGSKEQRIQARISVREEQHLRELLALMEEWGYPASIAKR
jgi:hypothetical protein